MHDTTHNHPHDLLPNDSSRDIALCPVTHEQVSKIEAQNDHLVREYNGKTYYLCCEHCAVDFDRNPEQYAPNSGLDA